MDQSASSKPAHGDIVGISLSVKEYGQQPSQVLTFSKSRTRVVEIGRRSAQAKSDEDVGSRALFRCPVISRKHAKITFAEYGNVYITDLKSHHGTYIMRPGDTVSKAIAPELPSVLADGDIVTLGKAVGRVSPITLHINLQFADGPEPIHVRPGTPPAPRGSTSPRNSSGRYGVFLPMSDSSSSFSDSDSDIEEISPPPPVLPSLHTHGFEFAFGHGNHHHIHNHLPPRFSYPDGMSMFRHNMMSPIFLTPSPEPSARECQVPGGPLVEMRVVPPPPPLPLMAAPRPSLAELPLPPVLDSRALIGVWPKSPEHSSNASQAASLIVPTGEYAEAHVSSVGDAVAYGEAQNLESRVPDDESAAHEPEYSDAGVLTSNVWSDAPATSGAGEDMPAHVPLSSYVEAREPTPPVEEAPMHDVEVRQGEEGMSQPVVDIAATDLTTAVESSDTTPDTSLSATTEHEEASTTDDAVINDTADDSTMEDSVQSVEDLYKKAQEDIERELNVIKAVRQETEAILQRSKEHENRIVLQGQRQCFKEAFGAGLKRKRSSDEDEDSHPDHEPTVVSTPSKRRRTLGRVVSVIAHTTAIASFGAVAAWAALAFS